MVTLETDGMFQHYQDGDHHVYMSDDPEQLAAIVAANPGKAVHHRRINRAGFVVVSPTIAAMSEEDAVRLGVEIMRRWHKQNPPIGVQILNADINVSFTLPDPLEEARKDFVTQVHSMAHMGACEAMKGSGFEFEDTRANDLAHLAARNTAANILGLLDGSQSDAFDPGYFLMPNSMLTAIRNPESLSGELMEMFYAIDT